MLLLYLTLLMIISNTSMSLVPYKPQHLNLKSQRRISIRMISDKKSVQSVDALDKEPKEQSRSRPVFWNLFGRVDNLEQDVSEIKGDIKVLKKDFDYIRQDFQDMRLDFRIANVIIFTALALFFIRSEIKESEMMEETMEMLKNMKNMPGFGDIFKNMGMPGMNPKKMNVSAMQTKLGQNIKKTKMKERMKEKLAANKNVKINTNVKNNLKPLTDEELIKLFSTKK